MILKSADNIKEKAQRELESDDGLWNCGSESGTN